MVLDQPQFMFTGTLLEVYFQSCLDSCLYLQSIGLTAYKEVVSSLLHAQICRSSEQDSDGVCTRFLAFQQDKVCALFLIICTNGQHCARKTNGGR